MRYNTLKKREEVVVMYRHIIIGLLVLFYLSSSYLSSTHIHSKTLESSNDCKVHILVKNLSSADTPDSSLEVLGCGVCFNIMTPELIFLHQPLIKGFNAQAPPTLS